MGLITHKNKYFDDGKDHSSPAVHIRWGKININGVHKLTSTIWIFCYNHALKWCTLVFATIRQQNTEFKLSIFGWVYELYGLIIWVFFFSPAGYLLSLIPAVLLRSLVGVVAKGNGVACRRSFESRGCRRMILFFGWLSFGFLRKTASHFGVSMATSKATFSITMFGSSTGENVRKKLTCT